MDRLVDYAGMKATLFEIKRNVQKQYKILDSHQLEIIGLGYTSTYRLVAVSKLLLNIPILKPPQTDWERVGIIKYQYVRILGPQVIIIE